MGKSYACHQLAGYARGDYLVFTDADTLHFPSSVSSSVACLLRYRLDALSVFPMQIMVTLHERMVVIFINFAVLCLVPIWIIRKIKSSLVSVANGQFMLFKKEVYKKIGGHRAIKNELIEDVSISKQVKRHGYRFMIFDGRSNIYCRMYKNFGDVVRGFSKFIFAAMDYSTFNLLVVISTITVLFLFPFILLPLGIYCFDWSRIVINLVMSQIIIVAIIKIVLSIRFKNRILDVLFHPLSMLYIIALSINSAYRVKSGYGIYWKGRTYNIDNGKEIEIVNDNFR